MKSFYDCVIGQGPVPENYIPAGKLSLEKAFAVYQHGYVARLTETLGDTFEFVWWVLGDDLFFKICREFIAQTPSETYNLSDYSPRFVEFLQSHQASDEFPFLKDLAQLGWLQKEVFHRPMEKGLAGEELLSLLTDEKAEARFCVHFELFHSEYCLFDLWKALKDEANPPANWRVPQWMALYKADNQVFVKQVSHEQHQALSRLQGGESLMSACENLAEAELTELFHFLAKNALLILARNK